MISLHAMRALCAITLICLLGACATLHRQAPLPIATVDPPELLPEPDNQTVDIAPAPEPLSQSQQTLDSAFAFYQTANAFWQQGDLENALAALDKAYALLLELSDTSQLDLLQQKEDLRITIARRIIEVYASRVNAVNGNAHAIPLDLNAHVQKAIKSFQTRERSFFLRAYVRSGRYRPNIVKVLRDEGLPEELSWLPLIESGFKVRAMSKARALGMWQFIASTGYKFGLERTPWIDERMDPGKATRAAAAYLKELHGIFGDWTTALAAYNCGEGNVLRVIRRQRVSYLDNFWDLYTRLPRETASYVPRFLAVLHIISDPAAYGFELPPVDPPEAYEPVTINKQIHLKTIAKTLDVPYDELRLLNPELRKQVTPACMYRLRVPPGTAPVLLAALDDIPIYVPPQPSYVVHRVRSGESLSVIAAKYHTSVRRIMAMNNLTRSSFIRAGWKLKIPTGRGPITATARPSLTSATLKGTATEYIVKKGDSLWEIARRFNTTTNAIKQLNQLRTTTLQVGQVLTITACSSVAAPTYETTDYLVSRGDSPYLIARRHNMPLADFLRINRMTARTTIYPGQRVQVRAN